ncbi:InlB B-repeat-containing protein, partial [Finegoldia magna]|uniref:InlB B-repeat-containing protein n=1 Tax=Finegoldia magna TaxID=1260 RepID=UPI0029084B0A
MNRKLFEKIITEKRAKSSNERPKYGLRKLTVGVVSCLLGYMMFFTPNVVAAEKVDQSQVVANVESIKANDGEEAEQPNKEVVKPTENNAQDRTTPEAASETPTEKTAEETAETEKAKAEKELEAYKAEAIKKIEEAFKGFGEDAKPSKSLEDYKKEVEEAKDKETVHAIVIEAQAEANSAHELSEKDKKEAKPDEVVKFTNEEKAKLLEAGISEERIANLETSYNALKDNYKREDFIFASINAEKEGKKLDSMTRAAIEKAITEDQKRRAGQSANNWKEEISQDNDYWQVEKGWQGRNLGGTSSIGMALSEINYLGTYTDANGNDVIRLQWQGDTRSNAGTWMNNLSIALKFQKDLYEKIDWNKSYAYSSYGKEERFLFNNVKSSDYQAEFTLAQLAKAYTKKYELPINLVLKDGVKISDLGKKDYLIQHRGLDVDNKLVLTNVPGVQRDVDLNTIEYGQFTRSTIVPLNSNLNNDVIPANSNKKSNEQRFGTSEYDSDKKVIRTRHYYIKSDSIDSYLGNVGFTQSFDARLLDLLKEDEKGNVAYLDVNTINNEKAYKTTPKVAIKRNQINVKNGVATIYVVGSDFKSNLEETGIKVVRATSGNIKTGIYSTLFKSWTINYVNTSIEYNVDEDMISKLFPQNKYLQAYAFSSGFVHENKDGFLRSDQEVKEDTVIKKGDKLTLEFKDRINNKGNQYVMQIGETYHLMNDASAPEGAENFETISERNVGGITSANRNMKYDITMQAGRTLHAGDKIKLWIINDNGQKYESHSWRLFLNTGNKATDKDVVNVEGENTFKKDYSPYYFQHSKSIDGVMVTKYKYVPQVEEIFDTDKEIKGTVRKDGNNVTGYYIAPTGEKFYFDTKLAADKNSAETIILDENGRKVEKGDEKYDAVYKYALGQLKDEKGEGLKLKKDMPIYINTARKGQFPSDPVIEKVKSRVTFDQNYEGKPEDKVVVAPENEQYLGNAGYTANGLDYNGKNVMPENPTREGYVFKGWATTKDAKKADFTKDTAIENSLTVYAVWEEAKTTADKTEPTVPAKTPVADKANLTDDEKADVKKK